MVNLKLIDRFKGVLSCCILSIPVALAVTFVIYHIENGEYKGQSFVAGVIIFVVFSVGSFVRPTHFIKAAKAVLAVFSVLAVPGC